VGPPLGVAPSTYSPTTVELASGSALVAFTDGLVERRGESIDRGLDRLVDAAADGSGTVDALVTRLTGAPGTPSSDDVAVLAFRWTEPSAAGGDRPV
jgi:serine phosphatase RsbU (regulator of sigma subunit)